MHGAIQGTEFGGGKGAMGGFGEVAEVEGADGDADEAEDFDAVGVEYAADLAVFSFVENDFEPGVFFARAEESCALAAEEFVAFGFHTTLQRFEERWIRDGGDLDVVGLVEMRGGVGDAGVPLGIVCEKEQAFAGFVEAADWCEPGLV